MGSGGHAQPVRGATLPGGHRLGVWCGREDPFFAASRTLAERTHAEVAEFDHGAHTAGYWRRVLPDALRFIGRRLDGRTR